MRTSGDPSQMSEEQKTAHQTENAKEVDALRAFAESFSFTVTNSYYSDAYLSIKEPHSAHFRLGNGSQFSRFIAALEDRRRAALDFKTAVNSDPQAEGRS